MEKEPAYQKQYLLMHKILSLYLELGITATKTGSDNAGFVPIYEVIGTPTLHFGTLVGLLNNREAFNPSGADLSYFSNLILTVDQINTDSHTFEEVAIAVKVLEYNKEVEVWLIEDKKTVKITSIGMTSIYTEKYLAEYLRNKKEQDIFRSTVTTNKSVKTIGVFTVLISVVALILSILQYAKKDTDYRPVIQSISNEMKKLDDKVQSIPPQTSPVQASSNRK